MPIELPGRENFLEDIIVDVTRTTPAAPGVDGEREPAAYSQVAAAELAGVSKFFGHTVAVADVSFQLFPGEVLALVGENGAGKSTCVKMLGGVYQPDGGTVRVGGEKVHFATALEAHKHGVAVVHQHPGLFADLSIAENVFAGQPLRSRAGLLDHTRMKAEAQRVLAQLGLDRPVTMPVGSLRISEQQLVEIARALVSEAKVLILDEPTAALTTAEVDRLFEVIDRLKEQGVAMMFVGHRLEEIFRISERLTVLRDGAFVDTRRTSDVTEEEIVKLMVGRALGDLYERSAAVLGDTVLELQGLTSDGKFRNIDLNVRAGEVVGMAGLIGSGRTEVARAVFGMERPTSGKILLNGDERTIKSAAHAISEGIAYVSEDRRGQSIVEDFTILDNATLPVVGKATRWGLISTKAELAMVQGPLERMKLKFAGYGQPIGNLSGGNQQKVVLAKWLATQPKLLILDEPTQGIDVQAKAEVHRIIRELSAQGIAILLISSDMPELLGACDRIYVMKHGDLVAEFDREHANQYDIGLAATGLHAPSRSTPKPAEEPTSAAEPQQFRPPRQQPGVATRGRTLSWIRQALGRRELGLLLALAAVVAPLSLLNTNFYSGDNLHDLADYSAMLGIVGIGQMLVILTRNIDLSVASTLGLAAYASAATMRTAPDAPLILGIGVALAVGLLCGLINGSVIAYGGVPSIVVTLGTLALYRGVLSIISSGDRVKPEQVPADWLTMTKEPFLGISPVQLSAIFIFALAGFILWWTAKGRETYFAGSNPAGAELIGIPAKRRTLTAFTISGLLAGAVGAMWASYYPFVDGQVAFGLETAVIAGVVVGGVALRGGSGTVVGVLIGTVGLLAIRKVLTIAGVPDQYLQAVYGAAIIAAVSVDVILHSRRNKAKGH
ncbi:ATP-binding cassette domain-containing protein [Arthrobacter sp. NPDC056691]|uniref:ATP-binding cassette domain-containing protein n=1 Tax=Arthrobacter sp. NPDC056691 TaxID=3345913 RepID=UPI00366DAD8D